MPGDTPNLRSMPGRHEAGWRIVPIAKCILVPNRPQWRWQDEDRGSRCSLLKGAALLLPVCFKQMRPGAQAGLKGGLLAGTRDNTV